MPEKKEGKESGDGEREREREQAPDIIPGSWEALKVPEWDFPTTAIA